ncbi:MAG: hypothetical protein QF473_17695 [Planctomycetota bacterium]|jgi:hypothetical protein|nr:hypothetical protein [Planctomycetota bacterium]MDP6506689.1 hypothetical protein [Planctomycetota bacterium]
MPAVHLKPITAGKALVLFLALLLLLPACGIQYSFRRPKKKPDDPLMTRKLIAPSRDAKHTGYLRAYSAWFADHATLVERLPDNPDTVRQIYKRLENHLKMMKDHMYEREADAFEGEVIGAYRQLLTPWPGASPTVVGRRLGGVGRRIRRDFAPGKFPVKRTDESPKEAED